MGELAGGQVERPILLAEDDLALRTMLVKSLKQAGYRVLEAGNGKQALELVSAQGCPPLLISDIEMPGMNGIELALQLREINQGLPVVFITGYFEAWDADFKRIDRDNTYILRKPFPLQDLRRMVRDILGR